MKLSKLGDLCEIVRGASPRPKGDPRYFGGDIPWVKISDITKSNGKVLYSTAEGVTTEGSLKSRIVRKGDLIVSNSGSVGKPIFMGIEGCIHDGFLTFLNIDSAVTKEWIYWYFVWYKDRIEAEANTGTQLNLNTSIVKKLKIPLPPLEEQKRIVAILDAADVLRQKDKALIAKYEELTQSLFLDMFGDPVTNPKGWPKSTIAKVCTKVTDGTHHSPPPTVTGYPYVTAKHVKTYGLDFQRDPTFIDERFHKEIFKRCAPVYGDVLYIKDGATTGIACINTFNEEISLLSSLALLKPDYNKINNYFLTYWLNNDRVKNKLISEYMSGAAIKRYTLKKINSFVLPVPPISKQNQFAVRVQQIEKQKQLAQQSLQKSEELFNSLLQQAFKGELTQKEVLV